MEPKNRKPAKDAVIEDGVATPDRGAPVDRRGATRSNTKDEAALETYEQPPRRGSGDDARSELSRQPDNMEQACTRRANRTRRTLRS
jgi:hypothetical protein